ncbi:MAG TPA: tetratricopeptide repeat protein, partial [Verrucomicrobiae bacterium]|nr:tetratricopeptide repeat protein [Verrucomicrobiae bacterium]
ELAKALQNPAVIGYRLRMIDAGREQEGCTYVPRLFRNAPGLFFVGRIHEQIFSSVEVRRQEWGLENRLSEVTLRHHGYTAEVTRDRDKIARNLRLLELAIEEMPNEPNLLMNFGLELARAGQLEAGLEQYLEAFHALSALPAQQIVPELRETLLTQLCTHLMAARRHEEIVQMLRSPLAKTAPLTASMHFALGLALMELKQPLDAAEQFKLCLQKRDQPALSPVNADIRKAGPRHCLALCLAAAKRLPDAEQVFQEALMDDPHSRPLRVDYARFLFERERPVDALKLLNQLVAENANDVPVWQFGGHIALSQPQFAEFANDWTGEAHKLHPGDAVIRQQRAEALLLAQKPAEALGLWESSPASTRSLAGRLHCELLANGAIHTRTILDETAVSQEFLKWYRRLINAGATDAIRQTNRLVASLETALPSAARALAAALREADTAAPK